MAEVVIPTTFFIIFTEIEVGRLQIFLIFKINVHTILLDISMIVPNPEKFSFSGQIFKSLTSLYIFQRCL